MQNNKVIFIRKNGRVIPIKLKKGSALDESMQNVAKSQKKGALIGAGVGMAVSKLHTQRVSNNLGLIKNNLGTAKKLVGTKGMLNFAGRGLLATAKTAFTKRRSIGSHVIDSLIGLSLGSMIARKSQSQIESKRLAKKFGRPSVKAIQQASSTSF